MNRALACLRLTTPSLNLEYPADAEEHFRQIHAVMDKWNVAKPHCQQPPGTYCGPWIENAWIRDSYDRWGKRQADDPKARLSDVFGPYVPLLVTWVDTWVTKGGYHFPEGMIEDLRKVLRPNVPYISVAQNDEGLLARSSTRESDLPNILVVSAGGYGHVPALLMADAESPAPVGPMESRKYFVSFMGSLGTAPKEIRTRMRDELVREAAALNVSSRVMISTGPNWRDVAADSMFSLTPRGYGRSSYHLGEILQLGLVPVQVYSDVPWAPYGDYFKEFGEVLETGQLREWLRDLVLGKNGPIHARAAAKEGRVRSQRNELFTYEGFMKQLALFMRPENGDAGHLKCVKLPATPRDN